MRIRATARVVFALLALGGCSPGERTATVPAGTEVIVHLDRALRSDRASVGDNFTAEITQPLRVENRIVLPTGTKIRGEVVTAEPAGRAGSPARLGVRFAEVLLPHERILAIHARPIEMVAREDTGKDVETVVGSGVADVVPGGTVRDARGLVVGGIIGAGAGTAVALSGKGEEIVLPAGQKMVVRLEKKAEIPVAV